MAINLSADERKKRESNASSKMVISTKKLNQLGRATSKRLDYAWQFL
jgi:hypothetical protein